MKLRLYHRPWLVFCLFAAVALLLALAAAAGPPPWASVVDVLTVLYGLLAVFSLLLAVLPPLRQGTVDFGRPERVLIVAPHQDDCVLAGGGLGVRNRSLGGEMHIAYLVQPDDPAVAATRRREAIAAWKIAGVEGDYLHHLALLPAPRPASSSELEQARAGLQEIVDAISPTVVLVPLFEGGHIHHDLTHHIVTRMLELPENARLYECPEYSPYFSLWRTPEAALALLTRFASFGLVAYYARCEGVGRGRILNLLLTRKELALKREMLRAFGSQNGDAMARHHGYADRLILWRPRPFRATPFTYVGSRPWLIERLEAFLPRSWVQRLLPGEPCTVGLDRGITNLGECMGRST